MRTLTRNSSAQGSDREIIGASPQRKQHWWRRGGPHKYSAPNLDGPEDSRGQKIRLRYEGCLVAHEKVRGLPSSYMQHTLPPINMPDPSPTQIGVSEVEINCRYLMYVKIWPGAHTGRDTKTTHVSREAHRNASWVLSSEDAQDLLEWRGPLRK